MGRATRFFAPGFGLLLCAALLAAQADRGVLIAQTVGHLLSDDLAAAFPEPAPAAADGSGQRLDSSLFLALDHLLAGVAEPSISLASTLDGAVVRDDEFTRVLSSQLNRYNEKRRRGRARAVLAPRGQAALSLELDVRTGGDRVSLAARLETLAESVDVARGPPRALPGRSSLLPPLLAIVAALALRRTLLALFIGVYAGAVLAAIDRGASALAAPIQGLWDVFAIYFLHELFDTFRLEIIGFVVALIAMVGVTSRAGGIRGLVDRLLGLARTVRSALFLTWGMGLLIFFDDYANCMLVGSTMRPLTDRLRVSREKLAYIVDSTAAPIAGVSLLSTWVAFEVSVFSAQLPAVGITESGYSVFLQALPFRYYCFFTLIFVAAIIASGRDFGPMARAERRARSEGLLVRAGGRPPISDRLAGMEPAPQMARDWRVAALPIALILLVTVARIFVDGGGLDALARDPATLLSFEGLTPILLAGGGAAPIFAGACAGLALAVFLAGSTAMRAAVAAGAAGAWLFADPVSAALAPRLGDSLAGYVGFGVVAAALAAAVGGATATLGRAPERPHLGVLELWRAAAGGAGTLGFAVVLLFEAWMIGRVCQDLATADYLVALLSGALPPALLPLLLFAVACAVAFATGSSWSTMSILLPNVVVLAAALGSETLLGSAGMVAISIGAVLDGSIFGDHCSPISDTTVLSSVASGSDHVDHVRTQAPYALSTAVLAIVCGYLPASLLSWWSFPLAVGCAAILVASLLLAVGRRVPESTEA